LNVGQDILGGFNLVVYGYRNWQRKWPSLLERKNVIFGTLVYENNGNYDKKEAKCHRLHVRRKKKENNGK